MAAISRLKKPFAVLALLCVSAAYAGVLPDDRADVLFHSYEGGGVTVNGPSVLVQKKFAKQFSASANYYVDKISSASVDVVTTASPYREERKQYSFGLDYLHDGWLMNLGVIKSRENDYDANTFNFGVSQNFFGDLTTLSLGYSLGDDKVGRRGDATFSDSLRRHNYRLGLSQILTQNLLVGLSFETITDEGFLNNPYRSVRYVDAGSPRGYSFEPEVYPRTRTSDAGAVRIRYYLPYRAALHGEYRTYEDTWGIRASSAELGYTHPLKSGWKLQGTFRVYSQDKAAFFDDLFPSANLQNFMARDKELATFTTRTLRLGVSYDILNEGWRFLDKGSLNLTYDHINYDYKDFRDLRVTSAPTGDEPLFGFDADVIQLFVSFWMR